jgi:hypothetical protein
MGTAGTRQIVLNGQPASEGLAASRRQGDLSD